MRRFGDRIIEITDLESAKLLTNLKNPLQMNSLPNVLSFVKCIREHPCGICFVGPARCGKTTTIRNIHFALMAEKVRSSMNSDDWKQILLGKKTVKIIIADSSEPLVLRYMPPTPPLSEDDCLKMAEELYPCVVYHFKFNSVHSFSDVRNVIISESNRVVDILSARYPNDVTANEMRNLRSELRKENVTANVSTISTYFRSVGRKNTFIFIDDYDVPFCGGYASESEYEKIEVTMRRFVFFCSRSGYICLFGSLSFPAVILNITEVAMFTSETVNLEKYRFLGISKDTAEEYLAKIGYVGYEFDHSNGMFSSISHEIHPLCFYLSVNNRSSFIEIGTEMKSYCFILNSLIQSPATIELVNMLYSKGWYWNKDITDPCCDKDIINSYKTNTIPISGILKILLSLGFIKKYLKSEGKDCLDKLGKLRANLPSMYYSFSNVTLYYSFTYFMKKLREKKNEIEPPYIPSVIFLDFDGAKIHKLCQDLLDELVIFQCNKEKFVKRIFVRMLDLFPDFLVVREFVMQGTNYRLDLGLFRFQSEANSYVFEFKITDQFKEVPDKDIEAIHQIYSRKYYEFIQLIDPRIEKEGKLQSRLNLMYLITFVTDAKTFSYVVIRKYNEKFHCNCTPSTTEGCRIKSDKASYPHLSENYYRTSANAALGFSGMNSVFKTHRFFE